LKLIYSRLIQINCEVALHLVASCAHGPHAEITFEDVHRCHVIVTILKAIYEDERHDYLPVQDALLLNSENENKAEHEVVVLQISGAQHRDVLVKGRVSAES
jgi:hypothetical protein